MIIRIQRLTKTAILPDYANEHDAGMDVYADESVTVQPHERVLIKTGIAIEVPEGHVGLVWDKSGIATHNGVTTFAGVIDSGYRGQVHVLVYNSSNETYHVEQGNKIAQLLIQPIQIPIIEEVDKLTESQRGTNGFGSSGLQKQ